MFAYSIIQQVCQCAEDCADETACPEEREFFRPLHERFRPKIERIYQLSWMWRDAFTLPDGRVQFRAEVSKDIADYQVSAFAVSRLSGFGILSRPQHVHTTRQFYIQVMGIFWFFWEGFIEFILEIEINELINSVY